MSIRLKAALIIMAIVLVVAAIGFLTNFFLIKSNANAVLLLIVSSLVFLAAGFLISISASRLVVQPFEKIEKQSVTILEARKRTGLLLNAMSLFCHLWKKMIAEIKRRDKLLDTINGMAAILVKSEVDEFESNLKLCMGMIAGAMEIDRVYIWKNHEKDGRLYHTQMYEWSGGTGPQQKTAYVVDVRHCKKLPDWEAALSSGKYINSPIRNLLAEDKLMLSSPGTQSIFVLPIFLRGEFWGFIGYDDCRRERVFTENEQSILSLAGSLITYAVFQNEMAKSVHASTAELSKCHTELEAAFMDARESGSAKSYFLARMSYKKRPPLNAIIGLSGAESLLSGKG